MTRLIRLVEDYLYKNKEVWTVLITAALSAGFVTGVGIYLWCYYILK